MKFEQQLAALDASKVKTYLRFQTSDGQISGQFTGTIQNNGCMWSLRICSENSILFNPARIANFQEGYSGAVIILNLI